MEQRTFPIRPSSPTISPPQPFRSTPTRGSAALRLVQPPEDEAAYFAATIHRPREWRGQRAAEQGSGLLPRAALSKILVHQNFCAVCEIGIGPDHEERELYYWYARADTFEDDDEEEPERYLAWESVAGDRREDYEWVKICGGCAERRGLPSLLRVIEVTDWDYFRHRRFALALALEQALLSIQALLYLCVQWCEAGGSLSIFLQYLLPVYMAQGSLAQHVEAQRQVRARALVLQQQQQQQQESEAPGEAKEKGGGPLSDILSLKRKSQALLQDVLRRSVSPVVAIF